MMASIIGAVSDNGIGMAGIVPNVEILSLRVLSCGTFELYTNTPDAWVMANPEFGLKRDRAQQEFRDVADAINHAVAEKVDVINMSIGSEIGKFSSAPGTEPDGIERNACQLTSGPASGVMAELRAAFQNAYDNNIPVFVAASNDNRLTDEKNLYTTCPGVIPVTAVDQYSRKQSYSNYIDLGRRSYGNSNTMPVAVDVDDTVLQKYIRDTTGIKYSTSKIGSGAGTSSAAAIASGVAGLMKMVNPAISVDKLRIIMTYNGTLIDRSQSPQSCLTVTLNSMTKFLDWMYPTLRATCGYSVLDANNAVTLVNVPLTGNYWPYYAPPVSYYPGAELGSVLNPFVSPTGGL